MSLEDRELYYEGLRKVGENDLSNETGLRVLEVLYGTGNNKDKNDPVFFDLGLKKDFPTFKEIKLGVTNVLGKEDTGGIHIRSTRVLRNGEEAFVFGKIGD